MLPVRCRRASVSIQLHYFILPLAALNKLCLCFVSISVRNFPAFGIFERWDFFLMSAHVRALVWICVGRFHARRWKASESNHGQNRKKMEIRAPPAKPATSKSSILQSIYGEIISMFVVNLLLRYTLKFIRYAQIKWVQTNTTILQ